MLRAQKGTSKVERWEEGEDKGGEEGEKQVEEEGREGWGCPGGCPAPGLGERAWPPTPGLL